MKSVRDYYSKVPGPTQRFGAPRGGRTHRGTDFSHSVIPGTVKVPALLGGKVIGKLAPSGGHGFGHQVSTEVVYGGRTYRISYAHGSKASPLKVGQTIEAGDHVLTEGRTGATTGSCMHQEVFDVAAGKYIDPMTLIRQVLAAPASGKLTVDGIYGPATQAALLAALKGVIGKTVDHKLQAFLNAKKARDWQGKALKVDGVALRNNAKRRVPLVGRWRTIWALQGYLGTPKDGVLSKGRSTVILALQRRLNAGGL